MLRSTNEDLIDLVACSQSASSMLPTGHIREDKDGNIIWSGLREVQVSSAKETMELLHNGSAVRQTNSTQMNAQSSRSHAIFSIHFTQCKLSSSNQVGSPSSTSNKRLSAHVTSPVSAGGELEGEWITVTSKFHFVDLAGSERLKRTSAIGDRIKEGISINSGLHALGNVISALGDPAKAKTVTHIPYRDSKLTRLLQDSLGGNAHTLMVACVSPTEYNVSL
ncbi:P-loop containing nucleoside triphosphate hydrolase protein [Phakopsora pachyrhizi]|nr:P-loop containing nucleoside triphosphate hydrolase protein [Phakopsora pachyrhizi]